MCPKIPLSDLWKTIKNHDTHKNLRSACLSFRRNLPLLFAWYDNMEMGIPNTVNRNDGHFPYLKRMVCNLDGMKRKRRDKFVVVLFFSITPCTHATTAAKKKELPLICNNSSSFQRRDRDSNPGTRKRVNGFRDRPDRPLRHLSELETED